MFVILKCIFVPFYLMNYLYKKHSDSDLHIFGFAYGIIMSLYIIIRLGAGINHANDSKHCTARSIADVIVAPVYTIGCNLGKDRFEIKLN